MEDPLLKLINNRVAGLRATGIGKSVERQKAVDQAKPRTAYKGFNASRGQALVQTLGGDTLVGPKPITNGAIASGAQVSLTRTGGIASIDQMPCPHKPKKKPSRPKSIFKTQFIVGLKLHDLPKKALMQPTDGNYVQPYVVFKVFYSSNAASWTLPDKQLNRLEYRGCGFWTSQMEAGGFTKNSHLYTGSGESGYYGFSGSQGPAAYTFTIKTTVDFTKTPPLTITDLQTVPPNWQGNPGDPMWLTGVFKLKETYTQSNPLLRGGGTYIFEDVQTFTKSVGFMNQKLESNAKVFGAFRGKVSVLEGRHLDQFRLDQTYFNIDGSGQSTSKSTQTIEVTGKTLISPELKRRYLSDNDRSALYIDSSNGTITDDQTTDIATCLFVREDFKAAIIRRERLIANDKNALDGYFLSSGAEAKDKKINDLPVFAAEIKAAKNIEFPQGQDEVTIAFKVEYKYIYTISSPSVGAPFIASVPSGQKYVQGYGTVTSFVKDGELSDEGVQKATLSLKITRIETVDWSRIAEGKPYGGVSSNNKSLLLLDAIAPADIGQPYIELRLRRLNYLRDNKIYIARNSLVVTDKEVGNYAEVFTLEEGSNGLINVVRQDELISGKVKPLAIEQNPNSPVTYEVLDVSCNPKNELYPFKVLYAAKDSVNVRLFVGGDASPKQIGKRLPISQYEIKEAYINNVTSVWVEDAE